MKSNREFKATEICKMGKGKEAGQVWDTRYSKLWGEWQEIRQESKASSYQNRRDFVYRAEDFGLLPAGTGGPLKYFKLGSR